MIGRHRVGEIKEGFDFISESKIPLPVKECRRKASSVEDESRIFDEKIMLYRKHVTIDDASLSAIDDYPMRGINEIMRLHLNRFTHKMDNPKVPVDAVDVSGNVTAIDIDKIYYVNVVFLLQHDKESEYHHFRIAMNREGVIHIDEL